jgi:hypothetical protein
MTSTNALPTALLTVALSGAAYSALANNPWD